MKKLKTLLSIAGSDNMAGAGIQADIKAATLCGVYCVTTLTAVTAQNSKGVKAFKAVSGHLLEEQLDATLSEITPDAVKIGIIGSPDNGNIINDFISKLSDDIPVIIDPVIKASAGGGLIEFAEESSRSYSQLYREMAKLPNVILVPNIPEAMRLLDNAEISTCEELAERIIDELNSKIVIVKGGHQEGELITDCLAIRNGTEITSHTLTKPKITTANLHGTGCTFSSLFASALIKEQEGHEDQQQKAYINAFFKAEVMMSKLINSSKDVRFGQSDYGPLITFQL